MCKIAHLLWIVSFVCIAMCIVHLNWHNHKFGLGIHWHKLAEVTFLLQQLSATQPSRLWISSFLCLIFSKFLSEPQNLTILDTLKQALNTISFNFWINNSCQFRLELCGCLPLMSRGSFFSSVKENMIQVINLQKTANFKLSWLLTPYKTQNRAPARYSNMHCSKLFTNFIAMFWWCCDHLHHHFITFLAWWSNKVCEQFWAVHVRISSGCITTTATMTLKQHRAY